MHARFEVSIARENRSRDHVALADDLFDGRIEWSRVADARCATVTDQVEAELIQILLETSAFEVLSDHSRAWRQGVLDLRIYAQSSFYSLFCEQSGGQHHARIRSIRARSDRRDQNVAMAQELVGSRKFVFWNLSDAVRGWTVVDHFRLCPDVCVC